MTVYLIYYHAKHTGKLHLYKTYQRWHWVLYCFRNLANHTLFVQEICNGSEYTWYAKVSSDPLLLEQVTREYVDREVERLNNGR